jgi:hypothetical protein
MTENIDLKQPYYKAVINKKGKLFSLKEYHQFEKDELNILQTNKRLKLCEIGFHFCRNPFDCFYYIDIEKDIEIWEIKLDEQSKVLEENNKEKLCTNMFRFVQKIDTPTTREILDYQLKNVSCSNTTRDLAKRLGSFYRRDKEAVKQFIADNSKNENLKRSMLDNLYYIGESLTYFLYKNIFKSQNSKNECLKYLKEHLNSFFKTAKSFDCPLNPILEEIRDTEIEKEEEKEL